MSRRNETPWERWRRDPRALRYLSEGELRRAFVRFFSRTVSADRVVSINGIFYELPRELGPNGQRGRKIQIQRRLLDRTYHVVSRDRLVRIQPVDLEANARAQRAKRLATAPDGDPESPPSKTAADMAFGHDLGPVTDPEGGCETPNPDFNPNPKSKENPS